MRLIPPEEGRGRVLPLPGLLLPSDEMTSAEDERSSAAASAAAARRRSSGVEDKDEDDDGLFDAGDFVRPPLMSCWSSRCCCFHAAFELAVSGLPDPPEAGLAGLAGRPEVVGRLAARPFPWPDALGGPTLGVPFLGGGLGRDRAAPWLVLVAILLFWLAVVFLQIRSWIPTRSSVNFRPHDAHSTRPDSSGLRL